MTEHMIENRVKKLQELEAQQKEIEAQAEAIRAELKADLEEKGVDELKTKNFILRWHEKGPISEPPTKLPDMKPMDSLEGLLGVIIPRPLPRMQGGISYSDRQETSTH